jgi:hypothetical protein
MADILKSHLFVSMETRGVLFRSYNEPELRVHGRFNLL